MKKTNKQAYSDSELIEGLKTGEAGFQKYASYLYRQWKGYAFQAQRKYPLLPQDEIMDAYADAIDALIKKVLSGEFRTGENKLSTLLYQIFHNKCVDQIRRNTNNKAEWAKNLREITPELSVKSQDFLETLFTEEEFDGLVSLMNQLKAQCKTLIMAFDYWGYSPEEVAEQNGYKTGKSVSQAKYRCMQELRKLIVKHE